MKNLQPEEVPEYYIPYINEVNCLDLIVALNENMEEFVDFLEDEIEEEKYNYRYQSNKWSLLEIIQHLIDSERVFAYRALHIARFDSTPLLSFDENAYAKASLADTRNMEDLVQEFILVRKATIKLFESLSDEMLLHKGLVSNQLISTRAIGYIIVGHVIHHVKVIREKYLA